MKVRDVMMRTAARCYPETNLAAATEMMWARNCGMLPVVDASEKLIGVITDRDICIALGTRNRLPGEIAVKDVARVKIYYCKAQDDIREALRMMAEHRVRRLPVVNEAGEVEGILSMDDAVLHADIANRAAELSAEHVMNALKAIYSPQVPQLVPKKLAAACA